ncbi:hypothetical protein SAMN04488034_103262 [Salinimicrobium catena]|uniref:DUF4412 domain-containing protein n=1 Tax=Salinimicrobium catena TaxID=390640 RepID=A0A1H5N1F9_9FLAO|nr:hypothetical protein [Salinimicrobium catena]SDL34516.1 hypothetical protein SAMN04488140_103262 [Salinimicrobium catena]SEE95425.1 hypothetical protein SAMN04488034_103262 [Salinimicrobium catena]
MKLLKLFFLLLLPAGIYAQADVPSPEVQIKTAVLAAPEDLRDGAMVYGYDDSGKMVVLREGTNNLMCLADDPAKKGISVSCYSKKLEPFMARGRQLIAEGKSEMEKREIRQREAESGELQMPDAPSMTYILSGSEENYDRNTGELKDANFRYVIYIPYATAESTGLPTKPFAPGMPWIMDPGTHRAHIMVTPPTKSKEKE